MFHLALKRLLSKWHGHYDPDKLHFEFPVGVCHHGDFIFYAPSLFDIRTVADICAVNDALEQLCRPDFDCRHALDADDPVPC